jgi:hypothetical protein
MTNEQKRKILRTLDRKKCDEAANALTSAFMWGDSPEGSEYWATVYNKLSDYSKVEDVERCKCCGQELTDFGDYLRSRDLAR